MRRMGVALALLLAAAVCGDDQFAPDAARRSTKIEAVGTVAEFTFFVRDGQYYLINFASLQFVPVRVTFLVAPGPTPIPPQPDPTPVPPKPDPKPHPVPAGTRQVILVRESADSTPEVARLIVALRSGSAGAYINDKGHTLSILDDDSLGPDGQPASSVAAWRPVYESKGLPCLIITARVNNETKVLYAAKLDEANATADQVLAKIKEHGG